MATDQNIKNKTFASEIDTVYGKYDTWYVHLFLVCKMYKEAELSKSLDLFTTEYERLLF